MSDGDYDVMAWLPQRVDVNPGGCWLWTGAINWAGYGQFITTRGLPRTAHRAVYFALVGELPRELDLDHLCRVRHCVNPDHLEPVTRSENLRRSPLVGQHFARLTHCKNGHPLAGSNLYIRPDRPNRRQCRTCMNEASIRFRQRRAA